MTPGIRMFELAAPQIHIAEDDPRRLLRDGVGLVQLYRVLEMWNLQIRRIRPELYVSIMGKHQSAVISWLCKSSKSLHVKQIDLQLHVRSHKFIEDEGNAEIL